MQSTAMRNGNLSWKDIVWLTKKTTDVIAKGTEGCNEENTTGNSGGIKMCRIEKYLRFDAKVFYPRSANTLHSQDDKIGSGLTDHEELYGRRMVLFTIASATLSCDKADKLETAKGSSLPL